MERKKNREDFFRKTEVRFKRVGGSAILSAVKV